MNWDDRVSIDFPETLRKEGFSAQRRSISFVFCNIILNASVLHNPDV